MPYALEGAAIAMTTARQIKSLFRPLIEQNDDLVPVGGYSLWIKPVSHVACRLAIQPTSDRKVFQTVWSLTPIYWENTHFNAHPAASYPGTFDAKVLPEPLPPPLPAEYYRQPEYWMRPDYLEYEAVLKSCRQWTWSDPEIQSIFIAVVEAEVLPILRRMAQDHAAYAAYHRTKIIPSGVVSQEQRLAVAVAAGALDEAREIQAQLMPSYQVDSYGEYEPPDLGTFPPIGQGSAEIRQAFWRASSCIQYRFYRDRILELSEPLRHGDLAALAAILRRWESELVRGTDYEQHWQVTPFPIEEGLLRS